MSLIKKKHVQIVRIRERDYKFERMRQFEHVLSLLNLPSNLLDIKYRISIVDLQGVAKKRSPLQKWLTWFIMTIIRRMLTKVLFLYTSCVYKPVCKNKH